MEYNGYDYRNTTEFIVTVIDNGEDIEYVLGRLKEVGITRVVAIDMYDYAVKENKKWKHYRNIKKNH